MSTFIGYAKLRPGRIHLFCPRCKRKMSNVPRTKYDPKRAAIAHLFCEKCSHGGKDNDTSYMTADGKAIYFDGHRWRVER